MNNFFKLLLLVIAFLLIIIYFQNHSWKEEIKREINDLKHSIEELKISASPLPTIENKIREEKIIYVGNSKTMKFHRQDCEWAKKINQKNKVYFSSKEEALRKSYQPCKVCKP